ncbi:MAG: hypothetical protein QOE34_47, partial [Verrucomicrobiota bacterium]
MEREISGERTRHRVRVSAPPPKQKPRANPASKTKVRDGESAI